MDKKQSGNREKAQEQKIKYQYKKEFKGAVRELKKDAQFIAKQRLQQVKASDAAYKRKINKIVGDLGVQEAAVKKTKKIKRL